MPLLGGSNGFIKTPCFLGRVRKVEVPVQWAGTKFCWPPFSQVNRYIGYEDDIKIMHGSLKEDPKPLEKSNLLNSHKLPNKDLQKPSFATLLQTQLFPLPWKKFSGFTHDYYFFPPRHQIFPEENPLCSNSQ